MLYICNAFSLNMLPGWLCSATDEDGDRYEHNFGLAIQPITLKEAKALIEGTPDQWILSAVGHADTAGLFSVLLGREIPSNRINVELDASGESMLLVGQLTGPRLPEGATELPAGAKINWLLVTIDDDCGDRSLHQEWMKSWG